MRAAWNAKLTGDTGPPSADQVANYLDGQLRKTPRERDAERQTMRSGRRQLLLMAYVILAALAIVAGAVGLWYGSWPLVLFGAAIALVTVLVAITGSAVEPEAWARYTKWEDDLLAERAQAAGSTAPSRSIHRGAGRARTGRLT